MSITIEKALLAKRILEVGKQVPEVRALQPAQLDLQEAIAFLQHEIEDMMFNVKIRKQLVSNTATQILVQQKNQYQTAIAAQTPTNPRGQMKYGGLVPNEV